MAPDEAVVSILTLLEEDDGAPAGINILSSNGFVQEGEGARREAIGEPLLPLKIIQSKMRGSQNTIPDDHPMHHKTR